MQRTGYLLLMLLVSAASSSRVEAQDYIASNLRVPSAIADANADMWTAQTGQLSAAPVSRRTSVHVDDSTNVRNWLVVTGLGIAFLAGVAITSESIRRYRFRSDSPVRIQF
ncbi:MAG: hypothetical protein KDA87_05930 [Planctomycetales bacterium]|nr:hypothetical protein [Planctomycetales bacterium]